MDFEQGLVVELESVSGLSGKVFPAFAGQAVQSPHVIYLKQPNPDGRLEDLQGHEGLVECEYQIDVYHTIKSSLKTLVNLILTEIKTWNFSNIGTTGPYIQHCKIVDDFDLYDDAVKLWRGVIIINVTYREE